MHPKTDRTAQIPLQVPILNRPSPSNPLQPQRQMPSQERLEKIFPDQMKARSEEDVAKVEAFFKTMVPVKEGTVVIRRHKVAQKRGSIIIPETLQELANRKTVTGTVLLLKLGEGDSFFDKNGNLVHVEFGVGDVVLFSQYAPFNASEEFPDLQVLHAEDVLFKLSKLPEGLEDSW